MDKKVYFFGNGRAEGSKEQKLILGGKGAGLAEMTNIGIPVPPGFTITTKVCRYYFQNKKYPNGLDKEIQGALLELEKITGKKFGGKENPLLVSVRSGAAISMPGMMDTILNLGLTLETLKGIIEKTGNERFSWDAYRRLIQMFGNVVDGIEHEKFEHILEEIKQKKGIRLDTELDVRDLKDVVDGYKKLYRQEKGESFPDDAKEQLDKAIKAVFESWSNPRAIAYRRINNISESKIFGTAVNVQAMVFGNMGEDCGTGVAFTRNPSTGNKAPYGEYLTNAQGEDVVAGIRTPLHLDDLKEDEEEVYEQLMLVAQKLERHFDDKQDLVFTIENGSLCLLQTRAGKRTAAAAIKIAVDMQEEGLIDEKTAMMRVEPNQIHQLLHPTLDLAKKEKYKVIAHGLPASPGAVSGEVVFSAEEAIEAAEENRKTILVRL